MTRRIRPSSTCSSSRWQLPAVPSTRWPAPSRPAPACGTCASGPARRGWRSRRRRCGPQGCRVSWSTSSGSPPPTSPGESPQMVIREARLRGGGLVAGPIDALADRGTGLVRALAEASAQSSCSAPAAGIPAGHARFPWSSTRRFPDSTSATRLARRSPGRDRHDCDPVTATDAVPPHAGADGAGRTLGRPARGPRRRSDRAGRTSGRRPGPERRRTGAAGTADRATAAVGRPRPAARGGHRSSTS